MVYQKISIWDKYKVAPGTFVSVSGAIGNWTDAYVDNAQEGYLLALHGTTDRPHQLVCRLPVKDGKVLGQITLSDLAAKVIAVVKAQANITIFGELKELPFNEKHFSGEKRILLAEKIEFEK